ncbi:MAG TPA: choice-of-anchor Q domain-containing protein [Acidimicrobiales bacterium]|nr:choice-of-anchor Q domain-containing protein [Acidimicrobiales bacterium]
MRGGWWRAAVAAAVVSGGLVGLVGTPASAGGTILYVASAGSDAGNCQTPSSPCATIAYAVGQAATNDTIDLGPGTFRASLSNALGVFLTIQGSTSGTAPITMVEPPSPGGTVFSADRGGWSLVDLTIDGRTGEAIDAGYGSTINVVDSTVTDGNPALCACGPTGNLTVSDSTVSGNTVGVDTNSSAGATITSSTIAGNGVGVEGIGPEYSLAATIVSSNGGHDCSVTSGSVDDAGYNLDDDATCGFSSPNHSQSGVNPDLGPLQDNGGPTQTTAPASGSPALDQIPTGATGNGVTLCPGTDQRGGARPFAANCDLGAVEPQFTQTTCSSGTTCTATLRSPSQTVRATGTKGTGTAAVSLSVDPRALACGARFSYVAPVVTLTDTGIKHATTLTITDTVKQLPSTLGVRVCYQEVVATPPPAVLLGRCAHRPVAPCIKGLREVRGAVAATLVVPPGDPRFHVGGSEPTVRSFSPVSAGPGKTVTISGTNLSEVTQVTFGNASSAILSRSLSTLKVRVPTKATSGPIRVVSSAGAALSTRSFTVT